MKVLLHFEDWQSVETRYVLEPVKVALNSKPSQAVVQSFVPPNTPIIKREKDFWEWWDGTSYFKGERVLKEPQKIFVS